VKPVRRSFLFVVVSVAAVAQQQPSSISEYDSARTYVLPEIVVTATRTPKKPSEIGRSITVLSVDQLRSGMFLSVGEALNQQQGTFVVGPGQNPGAFQSIFMRGAGNNQTAVFVDDVRVADPSAVNNALEATELSLTGIDRIEVVRGLHSTLYGSSAIGGVVNLITTKQRAPGLHADAELRSGVFGSSTSLFSQDFSLQYSDRSGAYANAGVFNTHVSGIDATVDTVRAAGVWKNRDRDGFRKLDLTGKVGLRSDRLDVYASWKGIQQKVDADKAAFVDDDNHTVEFRRALVTYGGSYRVGEGTTVKFVGGHSSTSRAAVDDSSAIDPSGATDRTFSDARWRGTTTTNELHLLWNHPGFEGIVGAGIQGESMTSSTYFYSNSSFGEFEFRSDLDSLDLRSNTKSLFGHIELSGALVHPALLRLSLAVGARLNAHSAFGTHATYELNPSYRVGKAGLLYGMVSTGFTAPSLYQLFTPERDFVSGISRGNRDLRPERSRAFELGYKHQLGNSLQVSMSYFNTVVESAIEFVYLWDKQVGVDTLGNDWMRNDYRGETYLNVGRQSVDGLEFSVYTQVREWLSVSGNVTLLRGTLAYRPSDVNTAHSQGHHVQVYSNGAFLTREVESVGLVRRPSTANLSVAVRPREDWTLRLDVRHVGRRNDVFYDYDRGPFGALGTLPVDAYTLVDLINRVELSQGLLLHLRVENVFDTRYSEIKGFASRGRGVFIGLRYALHSSVD
jgi:vitamin B12 transporter